MNEIGKNISKIRQERNLTQKELADRMHLHVTTISKWENGNSVPNLNYFEKLAEALEITTAELFEYGKSGIEPESKIISESETTPESGTAPERTSDCKNPANFENTAGGDNTISCDNKVSFENTASGDNTASNERIAGCNRITKYIKKLWPILVAVIILAAIIAGIAAYKANSNELKYKIVDEYLSEDADYFGFKNVYHIVVKYEGTITEKIMQNFQHELRKIYADKFQVVDVIRVFFVTQYTDDSSTLSSMYELTLLPIMD